MRIAILHVGDLRSLALGGVDQYIKNIIRLKGENQISVFGVTVKGEYEIGKHYNIKGNNLEYTFIPVSDDSHRPLTLGYIKQIKKYSSVLEQYDVIYSQRIEPTLPFWNKKIIRSKLIQVVHGSSYYTTMHWGKLKTLVYGFFEEESIRIAKKTNIVLMREEFGVPYYKKKYSKYSSKIGYAKIPVNTDIFKHLEKQNCRKELGLPNNKFIILYGGRVENDPKRVLLLPEIIKKLISNNQGVYLVIIGDGTDLVRLTNELRESVGEEYFLSVGYIENRETFVKYLNSCDVNINISEFEGTCTSSLEAIACGCRILSTDVGDIRLFVVDEKDGYIIKNESSSIIDDSVKAIENMISQTMTSSDLYKNYECGKVVDDLFIEMKTLVSK